MDRKSGWEIGGMGCEGGKQEIFQAVRTACTKDPRQSVGCLRNAGTKINVCISL